MDRLDARTKMLEKQLKDTAEQSSYVLIFF